MRTFLRDVSSQLVAALALTALGAVGVWLASLTPMLEKFAPFSYLVAFLIVVALTALAALLIGWVKQRYFPNEEINETDKRAGTNLVAPYDDAKIREEITELRKSIETMKGESEEPHPDSWEAQAPAVIPPTPAEQFLAMKERINQAEKVTKLIEELVSLPQPELDYDKHGTNWNAMLAQQHLEQTTGLKDRIRSLVSAFELVPQERLECELATVAERMKGDAQHLPQNDQPMEVRVAARDALIEKAQWEAYTPQIEAFLRDAEKSLEGLRIEMVQRTTGV